MLSADIQSLLSWYHANRRDLPWRRTRDPYAIWISETMLQQTTSRAVIPYFEKFLQRFPHLGALAAAPLPEVLGLWAGLGYYSRARNLHKAAQLLHAKGEFPKNYEELIELPGFGPYTARAVSSLAFSQAVGVLDGNVIRVMTRKLNWSIPWWQTAERNKLQTAVDQLAKAGPPEEINQALMELGSQICTAQNPHCISCPWLKSCRARAKKTHLQLPLTKPKRATETWVWQAEVTTSGKNKIRLIQNKEVPFFRGHWFLPGPAKKVRLRPKRYDFRHSITHHDIFVQLKIKKVKIKTPKTKTEFWVDVENVKQHAPASLVKKAMDYAFKKASTKKS